MSGRDLWVLVALIVGAALAVLLALYGLLCLVLVLSGLAAVLVPVGAL